MKLRHAAAFAALLVAAAGPAAAGWIGQVVVGEPGGSRLPNGAVVLVDFDYKITNPGGARFRVAPQSGGATVAGFVGDVSAVLPAGTGHQQLGFSFAAGSHALDHCLIEMVTPDWGSTLLAISVPVTLHVGDHAVYHLQPTTPGTARLLHGAAYALGFDAATAAPGGAVVTALPLSGGAPATGAVCGDPSFIDGQGVGTQWFRFDGDSPHVDAVRIRMWNAAMTELLLEFDRPVDLAWGGHGLAGFEVSPGTGAWLGLGQTVLVACDYATTATAGVRILARGVDAEGEPVPDQSYATGPVLADLTGHVSRTFTCVTGEHEVPYVQVLMQDAGSGEELLDVRGRIDAAFGPHAVNAVIFDPAPPAVLDLGEQVALTFDYATTEAGGVRIWTLPRTDGEHTPGYFGSVSPLYPVGEGDGASWFSVTGAAAAVDQVEFLVTDRYVTRTLALRRRDAAFVFGEPAYVTASPPLVLSAAVLGACRPNPFNPATTIPVELGAASAVRLAVYDLRGQLVRTLIDGVLPAGRTEVEFRAEGLGSGAYLYTLECAGTRQSRRLVLVR
ncbi:MAG: T9SS type A sorting domain-containing protein [Candidatus Latescibacteria bacterium]|nr:T9SS type A sorting domain-containing protein [Candidatus Latescibacterota bacterium]